MSDNAEMRGNGITEEKPDEGDDKEGSTEVDSEDGGHGHGDWYISRQFQISRNVRMRRFLHVFFSLSLSLFSGQRPNVSCGATY